MSALWNCATCRAVGKRRHVAALHTLSPMTVSALKSAIARKEIDTILVVFPDVFGRLIGKRLTARHFLEKALAGGTHACNYLLTLNIEMEPLEGFRLANWEKGFGDF